MLEPAIQGEHVPLRGVFTDSSGAAIAPEGFSGGTGPTVTVTSPNDTAVLDGATMDTEVEVGTYENVWDTSSSLDGTGTYEVEVSGVFSGETKILKDRIRIE